VLCQLGQQHLVQALPLLLHEIGDVLGDGVELLAGSQAIGRNLLYAGGDLPPDSGDPDHIELVEIRAENREKLDALEQRISGVERLVENPGVEREPAQFAIDVKGRIVCHVCLIPRDQRCAGPELLLSLTD